MDTNVYKLFKAVKAIANSEGNLPTHIEGCSYVHPNVPVNEATCDCAEFYWFLQGLYMTDAECSVKLTEIQPSDAAEIVSKEIRTKRIGQSEWTAWTLIE